MVLLSITPLQGTTKRTLLGIGHFYRIFFTPLQGIGEISSPPPVDTATNWVNGTHDIVNGTHRLVFAKGA